MIGRRPGRGVIIATFALLCLIWGSTWWVVRVGLEGIPPFTGVSLRFALAGALLAVLARLTGVRLGRDRRERALWLVNGILSFAGSYSIVYWSEQWVPSGLASVLFATFPLFVALLAHRLLPGESLSRAEIAGMLAGFVGIAIIFSEDLTALAGPGVALAAAVMLASPAVSAIASVSVKRWGTGVHPFSLTAVPMLLAAALTGAVALATESGIRHVWDARSIGAVVYLAVCGSAVTFTLYYWLLAHIPAKRLALVAYVIPVEAVALGTFVGEPLTGRIVVGAALVIVGVALAVHHHA